MKVLVTGGAGFIGSHVTDVFLDAGHEVWAVDDLSSGRRENLRPEVRLVVADIRSPEAARLVESERFEVMCHLAAQMDVRRSVADPRFDADVNVGGFLNLLEAARKSGLRKVVFSSTGGAIYGDQDVYPAPETHPTRPVSPYGVSKASGELYLGYYRAQYGLRSVALRYANVYGPRQNPHGEALVAAYRRTHGLSVRIVRIFNTYGPRMRLDDGRVVPAFVAQALADEDFTVFGDGSQTRSFCYVSDLVDGFVRLALSDVQDPVNLGNPEEMTILQFAEAVRAAAGGGGRIVHLPLPKDDPQRRRPDITRARELLGWEPRTTLSDGLKQTIAYFRGVPGVTARAGEARSAHP